MQIAHDEHLAPKTNANWDVMVPFHPQWNQNPGFHLEHHPGERVADLPEYSALKLERSL
jgi:hypothetical protein